MTPREALAQLLQLFALLVFVSVAFLGAAFCALEEWRILAADALLHRPEFSLWLAIGFGAAALLSLFGFCAAHQGSRLYFSMGKHRMVLDVQVVQPAIERLFQHHFGEKLVLKGVRVGGGKALFIELSFSSGVNTGEKERALMAAERHLERLLRDRFGYERPFRVVLT